MTISSSHTEGLEDGFDVDSIIEYDNAPVASAEAPFTNSKVEARDFLNENSLKRGIERVEELRVEEVRWFYQSGKKKRWKPFVGFDSILLETEWRCVLKSNSHETRVCIRGGMYEADVFERKCYPVYWSSLSNKGVEESVDIIRGTWFYNANFMPLTEDLANEIESEHMECRKRYQSDDVEAITGDTILHSVKFQICHVDWYSVNDVYLHNDAVSYRALRNIVQKFGASKTSTGSNKLHRGYREDAISEDYMPPVEHLVFVVHGIGSKPDRQKIVRNTNEFRLVCERVSAKNCAHYTKRVEFLPVEWRSELVLDNGVVETLVPGRSLGLRHFLNNNVMDIMYYTSPLYRAEIVDRLRKQILRIHGMFLKRNPDFQGKFSVMAHSLGSVIMHDIMAGWSPEFIFEEYLKKSNDQCTSSQGNLTTLPGDITLDEKLESNLAEIKRAKGKLAYLEAKALSELYRPKGLGFAVENFFLLGSPLSIFLALRGQGPRDGITTQDDIIPRSVCKRIFNIFHPADPIAYRIEPLVVSHYINIAPLKVHSNNVVQKIPYSEMPSNTFMTVLLREIMGILSRQYTTDRDTSVDISDGEEQIQAKEIEKEEDAPADFPDDNDAASNTLARRESYLKTFSDAALKVGKAILGGGGRSSVSQQSLPEDALPDFPSTSDDETADVYEASPSIRTKTSVCTSTSLSSAHKGKNKEFQVCESEKKTETDLELPPDMVHIEHRLDFQLQEGFTESKLGYASLTSHTSYWRSQDVSLFVLMQIHPAQDMPS